MGVTIKEYIDRQLLGLERMIDIRLASMERAVEVAARSSDRSVEKAETAVERRLEGMNEFRATLTDQAATFVTRERFELLEQGIGELANRLNKIEGRSGGMRDLWGWIVAVLVLLAALAGLVIRGGA